MMYFFKKLFLPIIIFTNNYDLLKQALRREVLQKYRGSYLGVLWNFVMPIISVTVYSFVFGVVFKARWEFQVSDSLVEFALTLFAGITIHTMFSECVSAASTLVIANSNYVKKVVYPLEILSMTNVSSTLVQVIANLIIVLVGKAIFMQTFDFMFLLFPLVLLPMLFLTMGISWFISALGVFFRDMRPISSVITLLFGYLTPVFYPISAVPEEIQWVMYLNPLTTIVNNARKVLIYGQLPDFNSLLIITAISYLIALLGLKFFRKMKPNFADVI